MVPPPPEKQDRTALLLWLGVGVAFSRVLLDLAGSLLATDAFWPILLPIPLMALCIVRGTPGAGKPGPGGRPLLALGLALELLGIVLDAWSIARAGLPLAVIGVARITGRPALPVALMSLWLFPVPNSILGALTPHPESAFAALAAAVTAALGAPVTATGPVLEAPAGRLLLNAYHSGAPLVVAFALLGWYAALRRGGGLPAALRGAGVGAALGLPLHALGVCLAALALCGGWPGAGRWLVDWGMLAVCAVAVVAWSELRGRR